MFGISNITKKSKTFFTFVCKIMNYSVKFAAGVIEEVTLNLTMSQASEAIEIPENLYITLLSKHLIVTSECLIVMSKSVTNKLFNAGIGATPKLLM